MKSTIILVYIFSALSGFSQSSDRSFITNPEFLIDSLSVEQQVSAAAFESFHKKFSNAVHPRWHSTNEGSSVKFEQDNIRYHVFYSRRGKWQAIIQYLPPEILPKWVAGRIRSDFRGYSIFLAQHVRTPVGRTYLVKIEKGNDWKSVMISPESTEVLGEYIRN